MKHIFSNLSTKRRHRISVTLIIILAAVLLELISAAQYYYSHKLLDEELDHRAETELMLKAIMVKNTLKMTERDLRNHIWDIKRNLNAPDSIYDAAKWFIINNERVMGGGMAFTPGYYPQKGRLYEPYAYRSGDSILTTQLAGSGHDYTTMEFYRKAVEHDSAFWSDPYMDHTVIRESIITYSLPIHDGHGTAGVFFTDVSIKWLGDTLNTRHIYPSSFNLVLTEDGKLISRPEIGAESAADVDQVVKLINDSTVKRELSISGRSTTIKFTSDEDGDKGYIYYANMRGKPHWQVVVVCYDEEAFGKLYEMRRNIFLMMLAGFTLLGAIIYIFVRNNRKLQRTHLDKERIDSELRVAHHIQSEMLPKDGMASTLHPNVDVSGLLIPAKQVGGDLYDFVVRDEKLFFCIGDVSGKGVPSALVMAVTHSLFRSTALHESNPARIMAVINETSCHGNESSMFVTMFVGVLDLPTGRLRYCNAGHDTPLLVGSEVKPMDVVSNLPAGIMKDFKFEQQEIMLSPGDTLFLYPDGLTEARDTERGLYGLPRALAALERCKDAATTHELLQRIVHSVQRFAQGAEQSDDLTMVALRYTPRRDTEVLRQDLHLTNDVAQVGQLNAFVRQVCATLQLDGATTSSITLAVEEAVVNVMNYAYPPEETGQIHVEAIATASCLSFVITDSGAAFAPTDAPDADTTLSAEERQIGGLGIHLVRHLMDSINYERVDGRNILTLNKKISTT